MIGQRWATAWLVALLLGCASGERIAPPPPTDAVAAEVPAPVVRRTEAVRQTAAVPHQSFESRQLDRAQAALRRGQLTDAVLAWEVLTLLRPERDDYRAQWIDSRRRIDLAAADLTSRAVQAQRRGDTPAASQLFLSALALAPDHAEAANALRAIERERNQRLYLGKHSRLTLTRSSTPAPPVQARLRDHTAEGTSLQSRTDLEHAGLQAAEGDIEAAISLLELRHRADRADTAVRLALADLHFLKAEQLAPTNRAGAIAALEQGLRLDRNNSAAIERLQQLRTAPAAISAARGASAPRRP